MASLSDGFGKFQLLAPDDLVQRRKANVAPASQAILNPQNANPLEQGEWVVPTTSGFARHGAADAGAALAYPVANPKGSTDVQARKAVEIYTGLAGFWAETTTYDDAGTYAIGTALKVNQKTVGGLAKSVLTPVTANNDKCVARVVTPPTTPGSFTPMVVELGTFVHGQ